MASHSRTTILAVALVGLLLVSFDPWANEASEDEKKHSAEFAPPNPRPINLPERTLLHESYSTPENAATAAMRHAWNISSRQAVSRPSGALYEFGGVIYRLPNGSYGYTTPRTDADSGSATQRAKARSNVNVHKGIVGKKVEGKPLSLMTNEGEQVVGAYHIHPSGDLYFEKGKDVKYATIDSKIPVYVYNGKSYVVIDPDGALREITAIDASELPEKYEERPFECAPNAVDCWESPLVEPELVEQETPNAETCGGVHVLDGDVYWKCKGYEDFDQRKHECANAYKEDSHAYILCEQDEDTTQSVKCGAIHKEETGDFYRCVGDEVSAFMADCDEEHVSGSESWQECVDRKEDVQAVLVAGTPTDCVQLSAVTNSSGVAGVRSDGEMCLYSCGQYRAFLEYELHLVKLSPTRETTYIPGLRTRISRCCTGGRQLCE